MRKSRVILFAWLGLGALVMFGFNNCGQVAFEVSSAVKAAALNELLSLSTVDIEGGAAYTRDHQVALALFSPRAVQMKISNNPDCSDGAWEPFAASKTWMLSQSNAQVMVYAQYKDELDQISKCVYDDIIHDDIPPQLTFTNATGLMTNNAALKVEWTATDNISGVDTGTCVDTENQPSNCTSAISTNASAEGTKTVAVKLKDKAGNTAEYKYSWILDKTPPTVVINVRPPLRTKDGTAHFEFSGSDVGTGIDKYFCRKAPDAAAPCTSPMNYAGLADGDYLFEVYATDRAGNTSLKAAANWTVVMTAPGLAFTKTPPPISNLATAPFEFSGTNPAQPINHFDCRLDGAAFAPCASPNNLTGVTEGAHAFEVRGTDDVGNFASILYQWTVDLTPPVIQIISSPHDPTNITTGTFVWMVSDNLGVKTIECRLDGAPYAACLATGITLAALAEGSHTLDLRATDVAGNTSSTSRTWVVDTTAPVVNITSSPAPYVRDTSATITFVATNPADVAGYECRLDSGTYLPCNSPFTTLNLNEGGHTFFVRATDAAGNVSQSASAAWSIDLTPPTVTIVSAPTTIKESDRAIVQFTVNDAGSGIAAITCGLLPASPVVCPAIYQADLGLLKAGSYSYQIMAADKLGNTVTKSVEFQVTAVAVVTCKADEVMDATGKCIPFVCNTFTEITSFPATIPDRTAAGNCYYSKLYDKILLGPSGGTKNLNVLSRSHDVANTNANPYILGPAPASRQFTLNSARAVKLSGDYRSLAPIKVDNYFLIGQRLATDSPSANGWNAYGTSDATIIGQNYVLAYNTPVTLQAFASGGTASVNALLLTQYFQPKIEYILDVHALDCGGSKELSLVYLMWQ